jgi:hypothetical protein
MLADTKTGAHHWRGFERIAIVTDTEWIRVWVELFGPR